ncbi:MAG: hypothetical protein NTY38_29500, partial [Acidobacteria bacterium]|nr:hypothetical protein [Acidobacteriota bacterium]
MPVLPPVSPDIGELTYRQKLLEGNKKDIKEDRNKRSISFNLLYNSIPIHYRAAWTKDIVAAAAL